MNIARAKPLRIKGTVFDRLMKTYYQSIIQQEIY